MNNKTPITVGELQDACAAARKNLDPKLITFLSARLADGPTPTTFTCEPGDKLFKVFGIAARLDKLEVHLAAADLKGEERMVAIFDAEEKNKTRGAAPKTVIGPSKFGRFRNDDNSVNLASVFDSEAEAAK